MDQISPSTFYWMSFLPFRLYWMGGFSSSDFIGWADFSLRTLLNCVSPLDFIRSGFLQIFIRLGEDDGWMVDGVYR
ncbi:hypothetical protein RhiirC2_774151 [Rhizophagus irregularis]|uniref:Uncharacterized protein n=1 Tax=Rhizophagus irregularis TaxID=588596 RepID=A0A2N1NM83_9GLOM|nr:hypothetical protein RhiirC2_774151 [Rhizophagus irregularis]